MFARNIDTQMFTPNSLACADPKPVSNAPFCHSYLLVRRGNGTTKKWSVITVDDYLLPGLTAGMAAKSGGNFVGSKVSTSREMRLNIGTPNLTLPPERSTATATP